MRTVNEENIENIGIQKRNISEGVRQDWSSDVQLEGVSVGGNECILFVRYNSTIGRADSIINIVMKTTDNSTKLARVFEYKHQAEKGFTRIKGVY